MSRASWGMTHSGLYVPDGAMPPPRPVAIDLFAGAGGFSVGFHQAGWRVAAAVEFDRAASLTYLTNLGSPDTTIHMGPGLANRGPFDGDGWTHQRAGAVWPEAGRGWISHRGQPDPPPSDDTDDYVREINRHPPADEPPVDHFYLADIRDLTGQRILDDLGMKPGEIDAVIGGPPCQGFSIAGKRNILDPRNSLVFEFARVVVELAPKTFVMENVPGINTMRTPEGMPVLDALALYISEGGMGTYTGLRKALAGLDATAVSGKQLTVEAAPLDEPREDLALFDLHPAKPAAPVGRARATSISEGPPLF